MIKFTFDALNPDDSASTNLWDAYVKIDYGRLVPEKRYKGFKTFLKDVTGANLVTGSELGNLTLHFQEEKKYTLFLVKWN